MSDYNAKTESAGLYSHQLAKQQEWAMQATDTVEPLLKRLEREKKRAEAELARLTELIRLLEANPDTDRILTLMQR